MSVKKVSGEGWTLPYLDDLEQLIPANNAALSRVLAVEEHGRELFEAAQRDLAP